jgi:hypothetical protein
MPGIVSNSTPLIHLAKIDELQLLHNFYGQVLIPQAVYDECVTEGKAYKDAGLIAQTDWLTVKGVEDRNLVISLNAELDRGESEAIALALQEQSDLLLLDDAEGREKARLYGLKYTGTLGILLRAKLTHKLPSLRSALDRLQDTGFWLDNRLYRKLLQEAGE